MLRNTDKTKLSLGGTHQLMQRLSSDMTRNFLGKTLEPVTSAKDLGVIIYSHLTYNAHIRKVVSSCMAKLCQINKVKDCFDRNTLLLIISALVLSKVTYCSTVWSNPSASNIKKLQAVQNFACRIAAHTGKFEHITPVLRQLKWLPSQQQLHFGGTLMTHKCVNGLAHDYFCSKFRKCAEVHDCQTRNLDQLDIPFVNLPLDRALLDIDQLRYGTS